MGGCKSLLETTKTLNNNNIKNNRKNMSAKVHIQKGNSPYHELKSLKKNKFIEGFFYGFYG